MTNAIFDLEMTDYDTIIMSEDERLYRIVTGNGMDAQSSAGAGRR